VAKPDFSLTSGSHTLRHQAAYNKAFDAEFKKRGWELQPVIDRAAQMKGDFRKADVLVEVQFGNSATLYRDYYKFHYGLTHKLLALAVLIVPCKPKSFFPTRTASVQNMAGSLFLASS
jgi:hypothetical protein